MPVSSLPPSNRVERPAGNTLVPAGFLGPFLLVTTLFILWGIVNNLNDLAPAKRIP